VVQAAGELDTVKDIFIINGEATGCTPFSQLLNDNGDGKKLMKQLLIIIYYLRNFL